MRASRGWRVCVLAAWVAGAGCTALREIPRQDYVARVGQRPVQVLMRDGRSYELDTARIEADSLVGYHRRDVEGSIDEFETLRVALDDVASISARRVDWYRTGLMGGLSAAAIVAAAVRSNSGGQASSTSGGNREPE